MAQKGYTNKASIEKYGTITIDSSFDSELNEIIEGVERTIDQITGRNFKADAAATPRLFDGNDEAFLLIDDAIEITLVEIGLDTYGGSFMTIPNSGPTRYFTDPANHTAMGVPVTKLTLNAELFTHGKQNQRITAKWGYSAAVPADIKRVATVFAFGVMNAENNIGGGTIKTERIGNYNVTYNTDNGKDSWGDFENAMATLDSYKRYYL